MTVHLTISGDLLLYSIHVTFSIFFIEALQNNNKKQSASPDCTKKKEKKLLDLSKASPVINSVSVQNLMNTVSSMY